jgi:hypothetical protein
VARKGFDRRAMASGFKLEEFELYHIDFPLNVRWLGLAMLRWSVVSYLNPRPMAFGFNLKDLNSTTKN